MSRVYVSLSGAFRDSNCSTNRALNSTIKDIAYLQVASLDIVHNTATNERTSPLAELDRFDTLEPLAASNSC